MLLRMDDTGLTDVRGHSVTKNGDVARSNAQSKFSGYSALFDGDRDYLTLGAGAMPTAGEFFLDGWFYLSDISQYQTILRGDDNNYFDFGVATDGSVKVDRVGVTNIATTATGLVSAGAWTYLALGKSGSSWKIFVKVGTTAVLSASGTYSWTPSAPSNIGYNKFSAAFDYAGYAEQVRWSTVMRETADYAVPTAAFGERLPYLQGTVKDNSNSYVQRLVRIYRRDTGALVGSVLSNPSTGAWSIDANSAGEHFAIVHDSSANPPSGGAENALVYDRLVPV